MKRLISFILLCSLLTACLAGCAIPANDKNAQSSESESRADNDTPNETEDDNERVELQKYFDVLEADAAANDKMEFSLIFEDLYNEAKESGLYNDSEWIKTLIRVSIICDYNKASDEDWYKQVDPPYLVDINDAFYEQYRSELQHGHRYDEKPYELSIGFLLHYLSAEDLFADYQTIKSMMDLNYVTGVFITYYFEIPKELVP